MWRDDYENLSGYEKTEFRRIANYLLSHTYMVRYIYQPSEQMMSINSDYQNALRFFSVMKDYFDITGWNLQKDDNYGIISLINEYEHNRLRIDKFTTLFLYTCRLIYEEERESANSFHIVKTDTQAVVEKMRMLGLLAEKEKTTQKERIEAQRTLAHYNIIQKMEPASWNANGNNILILPSILSIISNQGINDMVTELEELKLSEAVDSGQEEQS